MLYLTSNFERAGYRMTVPVFREISHIAVDFNAGVHDIKVNDWKLVNETFSNRTTLDRTRDPHTSLVSEPDKPRTGDVHSESGQVEAGDEDGRAASDVDMEPANSEGVHGGGGAEQAVDQEIQLLEVNLI